MLLRYNLAIAYCICGAPHRSAAGINPQRHRSVGGADSSTTKFALLPRLYLAESAKGQLPTETYRFGTGGCCGNRTRPNFIYNVQKEG